MTPHNLPVVIKACAPSDDRTSLGLSLWSLIILTGFVCIYPGLQRIIHFGGLLSGVCCIFVTYDCTERTLSHPQSVAEHVIEDLVANEVLLKNYCSPMRSA